LLEVPQAQLGYQYTRGVAVVEVAVTSGVVLTGRERAGDARWRRLGGGFELGDHAAIQTHWARASARVMRVPTLDRLAGDVDVAEAAVCAFATHAPDAVVTICADARAAWPDAIRDSVGGAAEVRSLYAGLTFGLALDDGSTSMSASARR
jgi:hypothetical protein